LFNRCLYHTALSEGCQAFISAYFIPILTSAGTGPEKVEVCPRKRSDENGSGGGKQNMVEYGKIL